MLKKARMAEQNIKNIAMHEVDVWVESDAIEAQRKYCTLLDEGKLLRQQAIRRLYIFFSQESAQSTWC